MAQQKLSPRQKMIGMMYLVLTAMLALNVSKEAVEAFKKVDNGLTLTIANYIKKNNIIYSDFERSYAENPAKSGKYRTAALDVKQRADEAFNFIQDLKIEIIKKAEKDPETPAVKGNEVIIDEIKKHIDDVNVPSEILIGANENGKAYLLKNIISEYRNFLISTLEGKNPVAEEALKKSLNTDDGKDPDGQPAPWANFTFQTLPLVAVVCILSEMQLNVRNGETEVLNQLYSQIDAASYKFTKIEAMVDAKSNYVPLGSSYEAKVFISASDSTQKPVITVNNQTLEIDDSGKGIYSVRPGTTGPKTWGGVISLKAPDGSTVTKSFSANYSVGEPNVVVSATAMNVMYKGLDNPIDISVPGVGPDKIKINKVINGTASQKRVKNSKGEYFRGNWAISPEVVGKNVQIYISAEEVKGKPTIYGPIEFRVKKLPTPQARFAGRNSGDVTKAQALAEIGVFASLGEEFDFELIYTVVGFTVSYTDRLGDRVKDSNSYKLTPEQKDIINATTKGKDLTFKNIRAIGPDGITRDLGAVVVNIK
jgi:gliding motility-associated protein GldM